VDHEREVELARSLLSGSIEAFEPFVSHFRQKVFRYSWLMCGQREDAEEVAQETMLRVFQYLDQLRDPEHVRSWVFRIAKNVCLMKRRKSVFAPEQEIPLDTMAVADWSDLPDCQLLRSELRSVLDQAIASLPPIYRSVLLLRDVEELSTEATAEILDLTTDAVKTRLHRARLAMRQVLSEYLKPEAKMP
jgi:RNA polymerase sigma-70 factor (ECF subfamily)